MTSRQLAPALGFVDRRNTRNAEVTASLHIAANKKSKAGVKRSKWCGFPQGRLKQKACQFSAKSHKSLRTPAYFEGIGTASLTVLLF